MQLKLHELAKICINMPIKVTKTPKSAINTNKRQKTTKVEERDKNTVVALEEGCAMQPLVHERFHNVALLLYSTKRNVVRCCHV